MITHDKNKKCELFANKHKKAVAQMNVNIKPSEVIVWIMW